MMCPSIDDGTIHWSIELSSGGIDPLPPDVLCGSHWRILELVNMYVCQLIVLLPVLKIYAPKSCMRPCDSLVSKQYLTWLRRTVKYGSPARHLDGFLKMCIKEDDGDKDSSFDTYVL